MMSLKIFHRKCSYCGNVMELVGSATCPLVCGNCYHMIGEEKELLDDGKFIYRKDCLRCLLREAGMG